MPESCSILSGRLSILKLERGANRISLSSLYLLNLDISIGLSLSSSVLESSFSSSKSIMLYIAAFSFFTLNLRRMGTLSSRLTYLSSLEASTLAPDLSSKSSINLIASVSDTVDEVKAEKVIMFLRCSVN